MSDELRIEGSKRRRRFQDVYTRTADGLEVDFDELQRFALEQLREMCENAIAQWQESAASLQRALAANRRDERLLNVETAEAHAREDLEPVIPLVRHKLKCLDQLDDIAVTRPSDVSDRVGRLLGELMAHRL